MNLTPFEVTVKLRLMPAQEPTVPQMVGGLKMLDRLDCILNTLLTYNLQTTVFHRVLENVLVTVTKSSGDRTLTIQKKMQNHAC